MRWVLVVVVAMGCGKSDDGAKPAPAAPPPQAAAQPAADASAPTAPPPPVADPEAYRQHLATGRALEKNKDYPGAIAELDRALAALPGDAVALSELSWAAFQARDYQRAKRAGHASVANSRDPKLAAASLYNLGRVAEAEGDTATAQALYRRSLGLRPNRVVQKRLQSLGGLQQWVADPLGDPETEVCSNPDERENCTPGESHAAALAPPFVDFVSVFEGWHDVQYRYAIRTSSGWYQPYGVCGHHSREDASCNGFEDVTVAGKDRNGAPILRFTWSHAWTDDSASGVDEHTVFCGVGTAGVPACADILTGHGPDDRLTVELGPAQRLVVSAKRARSKELREQAGTYELVFP